MGLKSPFPSCRGLDGALYHDQVKEDGELDLRSSVLVEVKTPEMEAWPRGTMKSIKMMRIF